MARIQILELPSVVVGEAVETPFAIIIDEADGAFDDYAPTLSGLREATGATAVAIFPGIIDIPAND